jgi:Tn3 transposase DDE domain
LTLILAGIIYWQAREIDRILNECDPVNNGISVSLLEHISPIEWDNVILYGEYVLNLIWLISEALVSKSYHPAQDHASFSGISIYVLEPLHLRRSKS